MKWANRPCMLPTGRLSHALRAALVCALLTLAPTRALAGPNDAATTIGTAEVAVVTSMSLVKTKDMNFGRIAPQPLAGTIVLNPADNTCTATGGVIHVGTCQAAEFGGMGARRMIVRLTLPTSITLTGPGGTMLINTITRDVAPDLEQASPGNGNGNGNGLQNRYRIVSDSGIYSFTVGGTLQVGTNQAPGVYTGTFDVTAAYQ